MINKNSLIKNYCLQSIFVSDINFNKQIEFLKKYERKDKVLITFDDGYKDNFLYAYPVLKYSNLNVIFFVTADFIDKKIFQWIDILNQYAIKNKISKDKLKKLSKKIKSNIEDLIKELKNDESMSWEYLKEIYKEFNIANHTKTHPNFSNKSLEFIKKIEYTKNKLKEKVGSDGIYFAYPDGDIGKNKYKIENLLNYKYTFITKRRVW